MISIQVLIRQNVGCRALGFVGMSGFGGVRIPDRLTMRWAGQRGCSGQAHDEVGREHGWWRPLRWWWWWHNWGPKTDPRHPAKREKGGFWEMWSGAPGGLGRCAGPPGRRRSTGRVRPVAPRNVYLCHPAEEGEGGFWEMWSGAPGGLGRCAGPPGRRRSTGRVRPVAPRNVYLCHPAERKEKGDSGRCGLGHRGGSDVVLGHLDVAGALVEYDQWHPEMFTCATRGSDVVLGHLDVAGALVEYDQWHPEMFTCATRPKGRRRGILGDVVWGTGGARTLCWATWTSPEHWSSTTSGTQKCSPVPLAVAMSREAETGGDDEPVEPVGLRRHWAFPMIVHARPGHADSRGADLEPRLFKG